MRRFLILSLASSSLLCPAYGQDKHSTWYMRDEQMPRHVGYIRLGSYFLTGAEETFRGSIRDTVTGDTFTGTLQNTTTSELWDFSGGLEAGYSYHITENWAVDVSTGFQVSDKTEKVITVSAPDPGAFEETIQETGKVYMFPQTVSLRYIIAPYGQITPYVGAGYNATFMMDQFDTSDFEGTHGPLLQTGFDWWSKNSPLGFAFDLKYIFWDKIEVDRLNENGPLLRQFLDARGLEIVEDRSEIETSPLVVTAGMSYRF